MAAQGFIIQDAINDIWCAPNQNRTLITGPSKISSKYGQSYFIKVLWRTYLMPTLSGDMYYAYQIGPLPPELFNLPIITEVWISLATVCIAQEMSICVYNENGISHPLDQCYIRFNSDGNLILAIKETGVVPTNFGNLNVHIELNSNAYFNSIYWANAKTNYALNNAIAINYTSKLIVINSDITNFFNAVAAMQAITINTAYTLYKINGRLYTNLSATSSYISIGDYIEAIVDASIKAMYLQPLNQLPNFTSTLDPNVNKRLFLTSNNYKVIDYKDDVDFYMVNVDSTINSIISGIFYNQDQALSVRMMTHNCYALNNLQLQAMLANDAQYTQEVQVSILAIVHHSGTERPLSILASRIGDLYQMSYANIINAMSSINSTISFWQCANLENSPYTTLIGEWDSQITETQIEAALGYESLVSKYATSYPNFSVGIVNSSTLDFNLPQGYGNCIYSSYDFNGFYIGSGTNSNTDSIQLINYSNTALLELTPGVLNSKTEVSHFLGSLIVTSALNLNALRFKAYVTSISNVGNPIMEWIDVTANTGNLYSISGDGLTLSWNASLLQIENYYPMVVLGNACTVYTPQLNPVYPGYVAFNIECYQSVVPVSTNNTPEILFQTTPVPCQTLDIFMNNLSLIEGIDYVVQWPQVVISKAIESPVGAVPNIVVRAYGLAEYTTQYLRNTPTEIGYIVNGLISMDSTYRLRHLSPKRVVINGSVISPLVSYFAEDNLAAQISSPLNGFPYSVSDIIVPIDGFTNLNTELAMAADKTTDSLVGDYLSVRVNKTTPLAINPILNKYDLYSPLLSAIITGFLNASFLNAGQLNTPYTTAQVATWIEPFSFLIKFDPTLNPLINSSYVYVRPHHYNTVVTVSAAQYVFLEEIIRDYLSANPNLNLDLESYINIG